MQKMYLEYALLPIMRREKLNLQEIRIIQLSYDKKMTISEISKTLNMDYKNTHRYISELHKKNLLSLDPNVPSQGKKVYVILSEILLSDILDELEKILLRKNYLKDIKHLINESRRKIRFLNLKK